MERVARRGSREILLRATRRFARATVLRCRQCWSRSADARVRQHPLGRCSYTARGAHRVAGQGGHARRHPGLCPGRPLSAPSTPSRDGKGLRSRRPQLDPLAGGGTHGGRHPGAAAVIGASAASAASVRAIVRCARTLRVGDGLTEESFASWVRSPRRSRELRFLPYRPKTPHLDYPQLVRSPRSLRPTARRRRLAGVQARGRGRGQRAHRGRARRPTTVRATGASDDRARLRRR